MDASLEFYAVCPAGFEQIVSEELKSQGIKRIRPLKGALPFSAPSKMRCVLVCGCVALRACCSCSHASVVRALMSSTNRPARFPGRSISVQMLRSRSLRTGRIGSCATPSFPPCAWKDAICDELRAQTGKRPEVSKHRPDVQINVSIHAKKATIAIDLAGEPLHKRGYRQEGENVQAPLKEALAAGVLLMSPWARVVEGLKAGTLEPQDCVLIDPFCGGGTLVIEGAMMAADMAPGILRDYWGFSGCGRSILKCSRACSLKRMRVLKQALPVCHASWEAISIRVLSRSLVLKQGG